MKSQSSIGAVLALGWAIVCMPAPALAASHTVHPGESIQEAVNAAAPGDTIKVEPGVYAGTATTLAAVHVTKPLKLLAKGKATIVPGNPPQDHGILVEPANPGDPDLDGVMIKGFTVLGFPHNGIWLRHVKHYKIIGNESIDNLENGIYPTLSANGLVKKNVSYGSQDSALWIEASENVRALSNDLSNAPTGLEITVSKNILAKKNNIHDNTVGVGLYHPNAASLPPIGGDGFWTISKNHIHDNNAPNSAPPGTMSAALPSGGGVFVLGVDHVTVEKNQIENNGFLGVGVVDWCLAVSLAGPSTFDCNMDPPIVESATDDDQVVKNDVASNGLMPPSGFAPFAADMLFLSPGLGPGPGLPVWSLPGKNDCFSGNTPANATTFPATLPACN